MGELEPHLLAGSGCCKQCKVLLALGDKQQKVWAAGSLLVLERISSLVLAGPAFYLHLDPVPSICSHHISQGRV